MAPTKSKSTRRVASYGPHSRLFQERAIKTAAREAARQAPADVSTWLPVADGPWEHTRAGRKSVAALAAAQVAAAAAAAEEEERAETGPRRRCRRAPAPATPLADQTDPWTSSLDGLYDGLGGFIGGEEGLVFVDGGAFVDGVVPPPSTERGGDERSDDDVGDDCESGVDDGKPHLSPSLEPTRYRGGRGLRSGEAGDLHSVPSPVRRQTPLHNAVEAAAAPRVGEERDEGGKPSSPPSLPLSRDQREQQENASRWPTSASRMLLLLQQAPATTGGGEGKARGRSAGEREEPEAAEAAGPATTKKRSRTMTATAKTRAMSPLDAYEDLDASPPQEAYKKRPKEEADGEDGDGAKRCGGGGYNAAAASVVLPPLRSPFGRTDNDASAADKPLVSASPASKNTGERSIPPVREGAENRGTEEVETGRRRANGASVAPPAAWPVEAARFSPEALRSLPPPR